MEKRKEQSYITYTNNDGSTRREDQEGYFTSIWENDDVEINLDPVDPEEVWCLTLYDKATMNKTRKCKYLEFNYDEETELTKAHGYAETIAQIWDGEIKIKEDSENKIVFDNGWVLFTDNGETELQNEKGETVLFDELNSNSSSKEIFDRFAELARSKQ